MRTKIKLTVLEGDRRSVASILDMIENFGHNGDVKVNRVPGPEHEEFIFDYEEDDPAEKDDKVLIWNPETDEMESQDAAFLADWVADVNAGNTILGYHDWLESRIEMAEGEVYLGECDAEEKNAQEDAACPEGDQNVGLTCGNCPHKGARPCPGELSDKAHEEAV